VGDEWTLGRLLKNWGIAPMWEEERLLWVFYGESVFFLSAAGIQQKSKLVHECLSVCQERDRWKEDHNTAMEGCLCL
jgi:hypothetical protein